MNLSVTFHQTIGPSEPIMIVDVRPRGLAGNITVTMSPTGRDILLRQHQCSILP